MVHEEAARPGVTERDAISRPTPCTATTDRSSLLPINRALALFARMGDRPSAPHSGAVVRVLTTSRMFALAVGVYQHHRRDGGRCLRRGQARPCRWSSRQGRRGHRRGGLIAASTPRPCASSRRGILLPTNVVDASRSADPFPLQGSLFCACGTAFSRWGSAESERGYVSVCGCRLWPIDADVIEHRVHAEAAQAAPKLTAAGWAGSPGDVVMRLYERIEVGGTVDQVRFVSRT